MPVEHRNVSLSRRHFNRLAGDYDSSFTRQMPTYGQMHETILSMAALGGRELRRVLELGAGTGTLTKKLLERFPSAEVTAVDLSAEMLALARPKLAFAGERVVLREADVSSADLGTGYDAVVSAIAFHHVPASEQDEGHRGDAPGAERGRGAGDRRHVQGRQPADRRRAPP